MSATENELRSPTYEDVVSAAERLRGVAPVTPLLESPAINDLVGGRLLIKAEVLQRTGSYKFRGAYNRLSRLDGEARRHGVVAFSTGNFGQAVAAAAQMLEIPAIVILPQDAPAIKIDNTRAYGADVRFYDRARRNHREEIAKELAEGQGLTIVPPGDDVYVIAGYGTCGLEVSRQHEGRLDALLCPCGGGGLSAGICTAFDQDPRDVAMHIVEPEHFDDTTRSLKSGERLGIEPGHTSVCDAILTPIPAELPFRTLRRRIKSGFVVKDADTEHAMALAFRHLKIVLEPAGAIALAAAVTGAFDCRGKTVAVICSGGSVDPKLFARVITEY